MIAYAGVGSRETPAVMLEVMASTARILAREEYVLRSGGAEGADQAFEQGCDSVGGKKDIYLPWRGFAGSISGLFNPSPTAYEIAKKFHPAWDRLSQAGKKLMARNSHQVLGYNCMSPAELVICWTKDGGPTGGTGQAIRIANHHGIPVFNLFNTGDIIDLTLWLEDHDMGWSFESA